MLRDRVKGKRITLGAFSIALAMAGASAPTAAVAAPTCEQAARIRCHQHWPQNFPHYATFEECVEMEIQFTCPPGPPPGGGGGTDWWLVCASNPGFCT